MNPKNYEYRFEIKPGKYVYLPTDEARILGEKIREEVLDAWTPDAVFFHLSKVGGHVAAMRYHKNGLFFAGTDVKNFFGCVTRSKIARALIKIGFSARAAFEMASASVVAIDGRKFLPYGFIQSMVLATLVLEKSNLGLALRTLADSDTKVSVFVDDITLSAGDSESLVRGLGELRDAAVVANFVLCSKDGGAVGNKVHAFNCSVSRNHIELLPDRVSRFEQQYLDGNDPAKAAIVRYIRAINELQADEFIVSVTS